MLHIVKTTEIDSIIGKEVGTSDWIIIDQDRINKFADATMDHQFIHVDPEKEINRINKEINYLKGFLESIEHKLSNTNFIMNAPQNVIEVEKQKQNDTIIKIESLIKELKTFNESR